MIRRFPPQMIPTHSMRRGGALRFATVLLLACQTATGVARANEAAVIQPSKAEPASVAASALVAKANAAVKTSAAPQKPPASPSAGTQSSPSWIAPAALSSKEAQGLVNLGGSLTERGDFQAAGIAYRQVLNGNAPLPQTKSALLGLARMHRKDGHPIKAAAIYERFLKDYQNDDRVPDALLELGRTLRDMGAPRMAIARFYDVINSTLKLPTTSGFEHYQLLAKTAQFEIAETHFQSGEFVEANKFYSRLRMLDLAPADRARAHFKSAYALQLAGDLEGAVTSLRAYLEQWPDDSNVPEARYLLATSLRKLKRPQDALVATIDLLMMEKARTATDPKLWAYWQRRTGNQLANDFFASGDIQSALVIYQSLAALSDVTSWRAPANYQVGLCYERLGDIDRACKTYQSVIESVGKNPAPEVADIVSMAETRLTHVAWRTSIDHQVTALFESTTGQTPSSSTKPSSLHDSDRSSPPAPSTM